MISRIVTFAAPLAIAAALAGCNKQDHNIVQGPDDPMANNAAATVVLPPSILSSKTYRCKDDSIVSIDWMSDKKSADLKPTKSATPVMLKSDTEGGAMTASGYKLIGLPTSKTVTLTVPGKGEQACSA